MYTNNAPRNPDGINTGNPLEATCCPVHLSRLEELHWKELQNLREMAIYISSLLPEGISISYESVRNWMNMCAISIMTKAQAHRMSYRKDTTRAERVGRTIAATIASGYSLHNHWHKTAPLSVRRKLTAPARRACAKNRRNAEKAN